MKNVPWWKEPTRGQWATFLAAWMGWVLDAFDFGIYIMVSSEIAKEFHVSPIAVAGSLTLTLLVRLVGGFVAGAAADRWGRRLPLMLSIIMFALCDGAIALAPSFAWVLVLRTLFGFGMGAEWAAGSTLAMENWPERSKKIISGVLQGSWAIGFLLANEVAGLVVPTLGWRALFVIAALPALMVIPIRYFVPESPEWEQRKSQPRARSPWRDFLAPSMLKTMAWSSLIMAVGFGVYYGLGANYPIMLTKDHGMDVAARTELVRLFYAGMLIGAIGCGWLFQRRGLLVAVVLPAVLAVPILPLYIGAVPGMMGVGAFLAGALGVGFCGIVPALLTSTFPAHIRGRAVGLVYHIGAFLTAFVPTAVPALSARTGMSLGWSIALLSGAFEVLLVLALVLGPRTQPQAEVARESLDAGSKIGTAPDLPIRDDLSATPQASASA